jgi:hypothetical protein
LDRDEEDRPLDPAAAGNARNAPMMNGATYFMLISAV